MIEAGRVRIQILLELEHPTIPGAWITTHRPKAANVRSIHRLIHVLRKTGHLIPRTRPGRFRVLEYASLRFDVWFIVQGPGWNKDLPGIANLPWQGPSALDAESASKALRPW